MIAKNINLINCVNKNFKEFSKFMPSACHPILEFNGKEFKCDIISDGRDATLIIDETEEERFSKELLEKFVGIPEEQFAYSVIEQNNQEEFFDFRSMRMIKPDKVFTIDRVFVK